MSYSPKINATLVRKLYHLKHSLPEKTPMTKLVNEAITEYLERKENDGKKENDTNSNEVNRINN